MSDKFSNGYKTRYSVGFSSPLNHTGFVCCALSDFISKEFGPGKSYLYLNDFHPSSYIAECQNVTIPYFFPNSCMIKRSERMEDYRKESVDLVKNGYAFPCQYSYATRQDSSHDSLEKMLELINSKKEISVKLNRSIGSQVVINDLVNGPMKFNFTADKSQAELINCNGIPNPSFCNVVDDIRLDIGIVIREMFDQERSAQEALIHYFMGSCPPYYIHIDFNKDLRVECVDYANKKLPPEVMINAVLDKSIDKTKINYGDLRFIQKKFDKFSIEDLKSKIVSNLKESTKEERDNVLRASFPNTDSEKINMCSDVARQMSACDLELKHILNVCKSICKNQIEYIPEYAPSANSSEYANLESFAFRIKCFDFDNKQMGLETLTSRFCEQAAMHVLKFDCALEYCIIGNCEHLKTNKRAWWYNVAQAIGKDETCKRIQETTKKIRELCWQ